jgi:hypothetical protein
MNKEKRFNISLKKMFVDRNLKFNEHMAQTFWSELKDESNDNLSRLFKKLYDRNFYSDYNKTIPRMPILPEVKETLKAVKSDAYITPDEFTLAMPKIERETKAKVHLDMSLKIKQFLNNGAKEDQLDALFAKN